MNVKIAFSEPFANVYPQERPFAAQNRGMPSHFILHF